MKELFKEAADLYREEGIKEAVKLAQEVMLKDVAVPIDQYGGVNIEQHYVKKYTLEEILEKLNLKP